MRKQMLIIYLLLHGALIISMEQVDHLTSIPPELLAHITPFLCKEERLALKYTNHTLNEKIFSQQELNQKLAQAAYDKNLSGITEWLNQGADDLSAALVHAASYPHNTAAVQLLVDHGGLLNIALQQAAYLGKFLAVKQLIDHGANDYEFAMYRALAGARVLIFAYIFLQKHTSANCNNCLFWAASSGNETILKYILELMCNPQRGIYGDINWALYGASMSGHHHLITLLIEQYEADDIQKAIECAEQGDKPDTAAFLEQYKGNNRDEKEMD